MPSAAAVLRIDVPCDEMAPGAVRRSLAAAYDGGWPLEDGLLVASELVTNAVQHSGCRGHHRLRVEATLRDGKLVISVCDPGVSGKDAAQVAPGSRFVGGLGLQIIQRLSVSWGTERRIGYRVWAELGPPV